MARDVNLRFFRPSSLFYLDKEDDSRAWRHLVNLRSLSHLFLDASGCANSRTSFSSKVYRTTL